MMNLYSKSKRNSKNKVAQEKRRKSAKHPVDTDENSVGSVNEKDIAALRAAMKEIEKSLMNEDGVTSVDCSKTIKQKMEMAKTVRTHFDGAMSGSNVLRLVKPVMERRGYTPENTLFAQSTCSDEINHEETDIPNLFANYLGEVFHLGGLAGIPFVGKTGFGAFSHHVPDEGHCFILMAPHIGMSENGELGKYSRDGQCCDGAACGAAVGALNHVVKGLPIPEEDENDLQMHYIMKQIMKRKDIIMSWDQENDRQSELVEQTYKIGKNVLDKIISTDFGGKQSTLVILTGIQINMPRPFEDFFQPITFDIYTKRNGVIDIFEETFQKDRALVGQKSSRNLKRQLGYYGKAA